MSVLVSKELLLRIRKELLGEITALHNRYWQHEEPAVTIPLKKLVKEIDEAIEKSRIQEIKK